ncbi:MAG: HAMP domain-containing sensor histidine kinase, partial [Nanoarchaeota archaeon]
MRKLLFGKIRNRLVSTFMLLLLLTAAGGLVIYRDIASADNAVKEIRGESVPVIDALNMLAIDTILIQRELDKIILLKEGGGIELQAALTNLEHHKQVIMEKEGAANPKLESLIRSVDNYIFESRLYWDTYKGGKQSEVLDPSKDMEMIIRIEKQVLEQITGLSRDKEESFLDLSDEVTYALDSMKRDMISAAMIIMIVAGVVLGYMSNKITDPINQLYSATKGLQHGDFTGRVDIKTGDEFEDVGNAFNKAVEELGKIDNERKQIDAAKTKFLSITSHELRSPMTPMKAQLQMLEQGYFGELNEKQKDSLNIAIKNADHLDAILLDFLDVSRIEAARLKFTFAKMDIGKMLKEEIDFMKSYSPEKKIELVLKMDTLPIIEADANRISQVVKNLVGNAIKFSPDGSTIEIQAKADDKNKRIVFSVSDKGIGISVKDQARV